MNATVSYKLLTWADMAHAGWSSCVVARKGDSAEVVFAAPTGGEEKRLVSISRLGRASRAQLDAVAPIRRAVKTRMRIS